MTVKVRDWVDCHPWTNAYVATVVTVLLVLELVQ